MITYTTESAPLRTDDPRQLARRRMIVDAIIRRAERDERDSRETRYRRAVDRAFTHAITAIAAYTLGWISHVLAH